MYAEEKEPSGLAVGTAPDSPLDTLGQTCTPEEEARVLRKIDLVVLPMVTMLLQKDHLGETLTPYSCASSSSRNT